MSVCVKTGAMGILAFVDAAIRRTAMVGRTFRPSIAVLDTTPVQ